MNPQNSPFWTLPADRVLQELHSSADGLSGREAKQRLIKYGANSLKQQRKSSEILQGRGSANGLLFNQFKSPSVLILMFAAALSIYLNDRTDAIIILTIVLISGLLGFWQELAIASPMFGFTLLAQTSEPLPEPQPIPTPDTKTKIISPEILKSCNSHRADYPNAQNANSES